MKRPLIPVALLYVSGILLASLPIPLLPLFLIAFALAILSLAWPAARRVSLCALLVMAGWVNLAQRTAILSPNDLRAQFNQSGQSVTIRGTLSETPYHRVHQFKGKEVWSSMARIQMTAVRADNGDWQPAYGRVMSTTREYLPDNFFAGQNVEIDGVLRVARGPLADGLFDYRAFLAHQGIHHQLDIKTASSWQIVSTSHTRRLPIVSALGPERRSRWACRSKTNRCASNGRSRSVGKPR